MITDLTYFVGAINLPTANVVVSDLHALNGEMWENELLLKLLGGVLYADLQANINTTDTTNRWYKLINGCTYNVDYNGVSTPVIWRGLKNEQKTSILSMYVYCQMLPVLNGAQTASGAVRPAIESGAQVDPNVSYVRAWNAMVDMYGSNDNDMLTASAYGFLRYGGETFDDWVFTELEKKNVHGL
jgi:hypothetical protein